MPTAARPACSSMRTVPCAAAIQVPEGGRGAAPGTACGADDAAVPTFIFKIEAVLGMSFCDPSSSLQRSGAISWLLPTKLCYLTRGKFREDRHDDAWLSDTRWVELEELYENCGKSQLNSALRKHRQVEQQATDAQLPSLRRAWSRRRS